MGWSVGYDTNWRRDIGYGVPSRCDQIDCTTQIDRGLAYVCGGEVYGGETGCGLYFCHDHLLFCSDGIQLCQRCRAGEPPFTPSPDLADWIAWKLTDPSWATWRADHPAQVAQLREHHPDLAVGEHAAREDQV
ncbi:hypothetical protein [Nocardia sp. IFM 10818]